MTRAFRNPLVRRLRRHYNLATLFRATESRQEAFERRPRLPASSSKPFQPGLPKSQAFLPGVGTDWEAEAAVQMLPDENTFTGIPPDKATMHTAYGAPPTMTRGHQTAQSSTSLQRKPAEGAARPPEPETTGDFDDSLWRRLQAIVHKHTARAATQEGGDTAPEAVQPSSPHQAPQQSQTVDKPSAPAKAGVTHAETLQEAHKSEVPVLVERHEPSHPVDVGDQDAVQKHTGMEDLNQPDAQDFLSDQVGEAVIERHDSSAAPVQTAVGSSPLQPTQPPSSEVETQAPIPLPKPSTTNTGTTAQTKPEKSLVSGTSPSMIGLNAGMEGEDLSEGSETDWDSQQDVHVLPLQSVWPVQAVRTEPGGSAEASEERTGEESDTANRGPSHPADVAEDHSESGRASHAPKVRDIIQRALGKVKSGQPTDSSIEVLPPRQPRPVVQPRKNPSSGPALQPHPSNASEGVVRRRAAPGELQDELPSPEAIITEIGPLPSDLWGLIDEPVPGSSASQLASEPTPVPTAGIDRLNQPPHAMAGSPAQPPAVQTERKSQTYKPESDPIEPTSNAPIQSQLTTASPGAPTVLQRALEQESPTPETPPLSAAQEEASDQTGQPDIDELARQVYEVVKRRFALERERIRRPH